MFRAVRRWLAGHLIHHLWVTPCGERITAMTSHMGNLYVATDRSIYVVKHDDLWR